MLFTIRIEIKFMYVYVCTDDCLVQQNSHCINAGGGRGYIDWTNIQFTGNSNSFNHFMHRNPVKHHCNGARTTQLFLLRHLSH